MPSSKKPELKVVLDATDWISALLWGGKAAAIINAAEEGKIAIVASVEIVGEISQVLYYPKLKKIYEAEGLLHEELIETILEICKFFKVTKKINVVLEHPADDKYIECALAANANYIVEEISTYRSWMLQDNPYTVESANS